MQGLGTVEGTRKGDGFLSDGLALGKVPIVVQSARKPDTGTVGRQGEATGSADRTKRYSARSSLMVPLTPPLSLSLGPLATPSPFTRPPCNPFPSYSARSRMVSSLAWSPPSAHSSTIYLAACRKQAGINCEQDKADGTSSIGVC